MQEFDKNSHIPSRIINRKLNAILVLLIVHLLILIALVLHYMGIIVIPLMP